MTFLVRTGLALVSLLSLSQTANADDLTAASTENVGSGEQFLVGVVAPRLGQQAMWASGFGGYDSARSSSVLGASAELALNRWLGLRAGFIYLRTGRDNDNARPNVAVRAQLLRQDDHGIDGAVALGYRQERYIEDGGLIEALVSVGGSSGRMTAFANASYAQDPERDDFEGELRAASLVRLVSALSFGLQGRYRRDLGSTDAKRAGRVQPDHDWVAGPVLTFSPGNLLFLVQGGVTGMKHNGVVNNGMVGLGGLGAVF